MSVLVSDACPIEAPTATRVYPDIARDTDRAEIDGATSRTAVAVFRTKDANPTLTLTLPLTPGSTTLLDELGGILVRDKTGVLTGRVNAPWAYDAAGTSMPTPMTVANGSVTQTVNTTGARFPVVADPHYTWGWVTGTVYVNKYQTRLMAVRGTILSWLPSSAKWAGRTVQVWTGMAVAQGVCVKVRFSIYGYNVQDIGWYPGSSGDGYCR